jgi:hypothetical protein
MQSTRDSSIVFTSHSGVGDAVGAEVGLPVGDAVGLSVGLAVGKGVGRGVGAPGAVSCATTTLRASTSTSDSIPFDRNALDRSDVKLSVRAAADAEAIAVASVERTVTTISIPRPNNRRPLPP